MFVIRTKPEKGHRKRRDHSDVEKPNENVERTKRSILGEFQSPALASFVVGHFVRYRHACSKWDSIGQILRVSVLQHQTMVLLRCLIRDSDLPAGSTHRCLEPQELLDTAEQTQVEVSCMIGRCFVFSRRSLKYPESYFCTRRYLSEANKTIPLPAEVKLDTEEAVRTNWFMTSIDVARDNGVGYKKRKAENTLTTEDSIPDITNHPSAVVPQRKFLTGKWYQSYASSRSTSSVFKL